MRGGDPYSKAGCKRGLSFSPHARGGIRRGRRFLYRFRGFPRMRGVIREQGRVDVEFSRTRGGDSTTRPLTE